MNALDTMRALASKGEVIDVPAGELIFRSGETGDCMYGVLEGTVQLSWNGDQGHEDIQAGDVFGAGALVTPEHRRYGDARALSSCKLQAIQPSASVIGASQTTRTRPRTALPANACNAS